MRGGPWCGSRFALFYGVVVIYLLLLSRWGGLTRRGMLWGQSVRLLRRRTGLDFPEKQITWVTTLACAATASAGGLVIARFTFVRGVDGAHSLSLSLAAESS